MTSVRPGGRDRPVIVDGQLYASVRLAARARGCSEANIVQCIRTGRRGWRYADGEAARLYVRRIDRDVARGALISPPECLERPGLPPDDGRLW